MPVISDNNNPRPELTAAERDRLARRYPKPLIPRGVIVATVAVVAAVGLTWLIWTALVHSRPVVSAKIGAYQVLSDTAIQATLIVDRPDPSVPVICRVTTQATDFQSVGEKNVSVEGTADKVVNVKVTIKTLRRATTATVAECHRA